MNMYLNQLIIIDYTSMGYSTKQKFNRINYSYLL